jgi:hypothetical protein
MAYEYAIAILTPQGRELGARGVRPDWRAALEWVRFEGIRAGRLPPVGGAVDGSVEPIWDGQAGPPYVTAFRTVVRADEDGAREIPTTYVQSLVRQVAAELVEQGLLQAGDTFRWAMRAFPMLAAPPPVPSEPDPFDVEPVEQPIPLDDVPLDAFLEGALAVDADETPDAVPVFVPQSVLDEAAAQAREAADVETGGVMVGKLHRDSDPPAGVAPKLFVEVTAQVPALHTRSASTKLTFTGDTWAAVAAAIALRRQNEILLGWWHLHPDFCRLRDCPVERRANCIASQPFLSAEDLHLHGTCFPSAYHLALLVNDNTARGLSWSLFGWSRGLIARRGFHLLKGATDAAYIAAGF